MKTWWDMSLQAIILIAFGSLTMQFAAANPVPADSGSVVPLRVAKLVAYSKVQREIKMTDKQRVTLSDAMEDIEETWVLEMLPERKLPIQVRGPGKSKADEVRDTAFNKLMIDTAEKELTRAQRSRLRQVDYQLRGPAIFADEDLQKILAFDASQREAAQTLGEKANALVIGYLKSSDEKSDAAKAEYLTFRKESVGRFTSRLNAAQRDTLKELLGEPVRSFDLIELWSRIFLRY